MAYSIRQMAAALGVSKSQVARDAKAGIPMQDLEAGTHKDTAACRAERAFREAIRRQREQLELEQLRNELVAVQEVSRLQFTAQRLTRDRVEMVAAPEVVALVQSGGDGFAVERLITGHLRQALEDASKAIEEIDNDEDAID